ncbi:branched-chain amino acid ABC transporter permease [Parapusillimonas granuli]|uniref:Branched-chain amino acid ABC transporter permease n=1 Tax=Parapusillimonas granuli TaxID=380911 RepID=A0A853G9Y2_9BURK|nr:branched-chain amino acid ABC transporter permease [Parapusillimonas granuli]MBB5214307.1 branched-chain amino acid transport system permease protein [Parapusillimonas granuli]MEB2399120.1 branched-chain amino acid ABC transporter permease [Alcaligenaceae bacterium]NYT51411.1 branched-chain amino acid ABC transporter permease [Parapusillimonas granuli]
MADIIGLAWAGIISGCLYAMGAIGLVLVYKSSNVVNFAHGNLAGLAAFLVFGFTAGIFANMAWGPAVLLTLVIMVAVMALSYLFIAPLVFKSDLTSTIATLGVGLIAQGATQLVFGSNVVSLDLPLPAWRAELGPLRVSAYDLAVLSVTALAIGCLYLLIERTRIGIAFRAVSAHPFASRVCGLNLRRIHLFSFVVAGLLGLIAALLIVPTTFLSSTSVASFMLQAFGAAVVGGFNSLPGAVLGGIFIGVVMNLLSFYIAAEFSNTYMLLIILLVLNAFPKGVLAIRGGARV